MDSRIERAGSRVSAAILSSLRTPKRLASTVFFSSLFFLLLSINAYSPRNFVLLKESLFNLDIVLLNGYAVFLNEGVLRLTLIVLYTSLAGIATTNFGVQLLSKDLNLRNMLGVIPGFFAAGCGCGIGILGLLGLGGSLTLVPFGGNWILGLGVLLVIYALYRFGDPEVCGLEVNVGS